MILFLLWAICPISLADFNINELAKENTFLHKTPSVSIQKLFTVGPHEREVQLDFNVDNSEEDPHSEVRRSAPEVRISEFGDKTIPLDELEQTTAMTTGNQSDARFDLPVYDFMVPAGKQANSTLLAMVIYKTKFEEKPTFRVVMDRLKWFEMGEPKITKAGDVQEYEIPILLLPGADVRPELTKNSVYKFGIEAQEGENMASSRVRVEVFSFSPTTKRVKTTTTAEETTTVEMTTVGTTTTTVTTEAIVEVTTAKATGKAASNEQVETASESSTAGDAVKMTTTSEAATAKATTESEAAGLPTGEEDTAVEAKEMATESAATHKDPAAKATGTEDTRMGQETEKEKNVMVETTTAESAVDGAAASATEVGATTSGAVDATATAEPTATATEGTTTTELAAETSTASEVEVESSGLLEIAGATMSETKKTTAGTTTGTTAKPTPPSDNVEGSGRSVEIAENISDEKEEEDDDNPLTEVVTMPTPIVQEAPALKVNISGLDDSGVFTIKDPLGRGDLLRGLVISAARNTKSNRFLSLAVDRPELFSIRPSFIESGGRAYIFANHPGFTGDVKVKVTASDGPISEEKTFVVKNVGKKAMNTVKREMFSLTEDAPSGTVVGRAGEGWKIAGKPGLFALVGQDIILSCPSEAPCLDYESQHAHYLLLISKTDPSLASEVVIQISDVNDNPPSIEATDAVIRVSDGELIMPFAVQIVDPDSPSVQENELRTNGPAAEFLALEKVDADLYQVAVKGPSSPGRYDLLLEVSDRNQKSHKKIRVLVQNSHSHAHFRRGRYERSVTPERLRPGAEVTRVELEGIPIDEAKFVLLKGNPGWLTVDDYGGTVTFTRPTRIPSSGVYEATVAAIGRETGRILAQTVVSVTIVGPPEVKKVFKKSIYERTIDRESSPEISISLETPPGTVLSLDKSSLFAIDENGQKEVLSIDDVTISGDTVTFSKDIVSSLRVLRLEVTSGEERAVVVVHLTSSPSFLEHRRRMASRPQFPAMPTVIEIAEELPVGHIVAVLPAVHPETGDTVESTVEGAEGAFELEKRTGALKIAKRLDFDDPRVPKEYNLKISAGDDGYETTVLLKIRVMDEDDNPPVIQREGLAVKVVMPENLPLDTIISRLTVTDRDEISLHDGLTVALSGLSSSLFHSTIANGTITIKVAGTLDRENISQHPLLVTVSDPAGHTDSVAITVFLGDVNDNAPKFLKEIYNVQAVENWPAGLVLETIKAIDEDSQERGMVTYSLESLNSKYFSLNSTSGELFISRDLMGLAREEPYLLTAVAVDGGNPPLNTTVPIRITVSEPRKPNVPVLNFLTPLPGHVLQLKGDLKENEKVYQAKARVEGDARNVKYSIEELATSAQSPFGIDELSGEIIVFKAPSRPSNHVLLITARHLHSGATATRLLRAHFTTSSRLSPVFPEGAPLYYQFRKGADIGKISAEVEDDGPTFYYLIPSCSPSSALFTLNSSTGQLFHSGPEVPKGPRVELCVLASTAPLKETANLIYNPKRSDMVTVVVASGQEEEALPDLSHLNNTVTTIDRHLSSVGIRLFEEVKQSYNFSIEHIEFTPSESVLPLTTAAPLPSLFSVDRRGVVRAAPGIVSQPSGVYSVNVEAKTEMGDNKKLVQEFHLVPPTARLRFVFDKPLIPVAKEFRFFKRDLQDTISKTEDPLRFVVDQPKQYVYNTSRSSACFHVIGAHSLLSPHSTIGALSKIGDLFQVYNNFSIVDIETTCEEPKIVELPMAAALASPTVLLLVSVLAFAILLFFLICVYFCFVRRYRDYLKAKEKAMKGPPQPVPATPTFVLTPPPPMGSSSPRMASLGYWEG